MSHASLGRTLAAECLGTFTLIVFGVGSVAQVLLSGETKGDFFSINVGWGLGVALGVYVAGGVSGAHLNPAVTLALALRRGFPWGRVLPYIGAQVAGAFLASAVVYVTYMDALARYEASLPDAATTTAAGEPRHRMETAGIWATYPADHLEPIRGGLIDQVVGTALLVMCIFALSDDRNLAPPPGVAPWLVGSVVVAIGICFGFNCGYAINPARDFGPRLFTYLAGWGGRVFQAGDCFWWVPIVGPLAGGVLGGLAYDTLVHNLHPQEEAGPAGVAKEG